MRDSGGDTDEGFRYGNNNDDDCDDDYDYSFFQQTVNFEKSMCVFHTVVSLVEQANAFSYVLLKSNCLRTYQIVHILKSHLVQLTATGIFFKTWSKTFIFLQENK